MTFEELKMFELNKQTDDLTKHTTDWINVVTTYGIKNDGITDVTKALQVVLDKIDDGSILYFPEGSYLISAGLHLSKQITLMGCTTAIREHPYYQNYSKIVLAPGISNITMIAVTVDYTRVCIKNLTLWSSSYEITYNKNKPVNGSPATIYDIKMVNTNVNGVKLLNYGSTLDNVHVYGCSGSAFIGGGYNFIYNCTAYNCRVGFALGGDNSMVQCRVQNCENALTITGMANVITNFRVDEAAKEAIILNKAYRNVLSDIQVDQINYCAVKITDSYRNKISGDLSRSGQYYAGTPINSVPDAEKYKACAIAFYGNACFNLIDCLVSCEEALDDSLQNSKGPSAKMVNYGFLKESNINIAGDLFDGTFAVTTDKLNQVMYMVSGTLEHVVIDYSGLSIRYLANASSHEYADINGVRALNVSNITYVTPVYVGEMIIYNSNLYIGYANKVGSWKQLYP